MAVGERHGQPALALVVEALATVFEPVDGVAPARSALGGSASAREKHVELCLPGGKARRRGRVKPARRAHARGQHQRDHFQHGVRIHRLTSASFEVLNVGKTSWLLLILNGY